MNRTHVDIVNKKTNGRPEEVFEMVHRIMHLFRGAQYRTLKGHSLTHLEGKLLGYFAAHPGATLRDLAAHSRQDKGQLAKLIKNLKEQGLLEGREDATDRRSVPLHLTKDGKATHRALQRRVSLLSQRAVEGIGADEQGRLVELLRQVQGNLEGI